MNLTFSMSFVLQSQFTDNICGTSYVLRPLTNEVIPLGDCNANYAKSNDNREFKSILTLNGFKQLIKKPTRTTQHTSSIIDIIATNKENIKLANVIPTTLSDHDMVGCVRKVNHSKFVPRTIRCRDYSSFTADFLFCLNCWKHENAIIQHQIKFIKIELKKSHSFIKLCQVNFTWPQ